MSEPLTRSVEVATTAGCARAYGYSLDPVRLRETYLSYESEQGASREQLRAIEQSYDATYQQVSGSNGQSSRLAAVQKLAQRGYRRLIVAVACWVVPSIVPP